MIFFSEIVQGPKLMRLHLLFSHAYHSHALFHLILLVFILLLTGKTVIQKNKLRCISLQNQIWLTLKKPHLPATPFLIILSQRNVLEP